ncbi:MAG: hypothetical protein IPP96_14475 [Chitinophagaceae bacterium]|nr:hypothetical protein [Chitinophagaceae bacterium]
MNFSRSIINKIVFTVLALFAATWVTAQTTTPATGQPVTTSGYNQLAILLVVMIVVLAFVIWGMGQVLTAFGRQLLEKNKNTSKTLPVVMLLGLSLLSQVSAAQDAATTVVKEVPNYGGLSESTYYIFLTVLGMEVFVILFLAFSIRRMYTELLPEKIKTAREKQNWQPRGRGWIKKYSPGQYRLNGKPM